MKRIVSMLCAAAVIVSAAGPIPVKAEITVNAEGYPFYLLNMDSYLEDDFPLWFEEGVDDLPYVDLESFADLYNVIRTEVGNEMDFSVSVEADGDTVKLVRENGYFMELDYDKNTISFNDYDAFIHKSRPSVLLDILSEQGFNEEGEAELFYRDTEASYDRYGDYITLNLSDYDIQLFKADKYYFVPLQTMSDFLISPPLGMSILFNGRGLLLANANALASDQGGLTPLGEYYYSSGPRERSKELAEFSYSELCLMLDCLYGLKAVHDVTSFDKLFWQLGIDGHLKSTDPVEADNALIDFINYTLDDLHSGFQLPSWMAGTSVEDTGMGFSYAKMDSHIKEYSAARKAAYPDGLYAYEEVGNTAFVTFDKFNSNFAYIYYLQQEQSDAENPEEPISAAEEAPDDLQAESAPEEAEPEQEQGEDPSVIDVDTISLIIEAHKRITREGSPIENVVIDLSNNGGGDADAAIFVMSWFLGDAPLCLSNPFTGALSNAIYRADVNLDRKFDADDTVQNLNLYCLISPVSFSCGNLLPSVFKNSQKVTLLGKTSGGGSCVVQNISTASGTLFQISGSGRLSFTKNGSWYDIDQGMEPDVYIDDIRNYYDREKLVNYINNLL